MLNYCSFAEQYGYDETFLVLRQTLSLLVQNGSANFQCQLICESNAIMLKYPANLIKLGHS